ncbi:MAG: MerR family transcriptional regulator [Bacteroidales bacterium]
MSESERKLTKLYYNIGEVADILNESTSLVRFWTEKFSKFVKPERNKKGNRRYTVKDIEALKSIHYLVKICGMTLEGASAKMKISTKDVNQKAEIVSKLNNIRSKLISISDILREKEDNNLKNESI